MALIELFEVAPGDDDAFLAEWRRERGGATLYRALRDDAAVRFVSVSLADTGGYELVHEDGTPDVAGGATQITPLAEDVSVWHQLREAMSAQRGYLGTRLYRALGPTDVRHIAITRWSSPLMVARASHEIEFPSGAALYLPVDP